MDRILFHCLDIDLKSAVRHLKSAILVGALLFALSFLGVLVSALCSVLLATCSSAQAQQTPKIPPCRDSLRWRAGSAAPGIV